MTPGARASAAIGILDQIAAGSSAERALTNWGRASRFAGSGDRAAVRDLVFGALRCLRSFAGLGGAADGRGLLIGSMVAAGEDPDTLFTGIGHAPAVLDMAERAHLAALPPLEPLAALDCPDWLAPALQASLGERFAPVMRLLQARAPVCLRVNLARSSVGAAVEALAAEGITAEPHALAGSALLVTGNARKIQTSQAYASGLVELQDVASQAVVQALPLTGGARVLDYCAGGGGKALAMAAAGARVWAHDIDPGRMRDLPARAGRAGVTIETVTGPGIAAIAPFDLVLLDVPCSGSGSWRRSPEGKWTLTAARLAEMQVVQAGLLDLATSLVEGGGLLAYVTCSLLDSENSSQVSAFLQRTPGWRQVLERSFTPLDGGDGFYVALLTRE